MFLTNGVIGAVTPKAATFTTVTAATNITTGADLNSSGVLAAGTGAHAIIVEAWTNVTTQDCRCYRNNSRILPDYFL